MGVGKVEAEKQRDLLNWTVLQKGKDIFRERQRYGKLKHRLYKHDQVTLKELREFFEKKKLTHKIKSFPFIGAVLGGK